MFGSACDLNHAGRKDLSGSIKVVGVARPKLAIIVLSRGEDASVGFQMRWLVPPAMPVTPEEMI